MLQYSVDYLENLLKRRLELYQALRDISLVQVSVLEQLNKNNYFEESNKLNDIVKRKNKVMEQLEPIEKECLVIQEHWSELSKNYQPSESARLTKLFQELKNVIAEILSIEGRTDKLLKEQRASLNKEYAAIEKSGNILKTYKAKNIADKSKLFDLEG